MAVKLAIKFFEGTIAAEPMKPLSDLPAVLGEIFRVDSMADVDGVAIGGWETFHSTDPRLARQTDTTECTFPVRQRRTLPYDLVVGVAGGHGGGDGVWPGRQVA